MKDGGAIGAMDRTTHGTTAGEATSAGALMADTTMSVGTAIIVGDRIVATAAATAATIMTAAIDGSMPPRQSATFFTKASLFDLNRAAHCKHGHPLSRSRRWDAYLSTPPKPRAPSAGGFPDALPQAAASSPGAASSVAGRLNFSRVYVRFRMRGAWLR